MSASILVAYATRYGSTQEVAEAVAAALREDGQTVDCRPAKEVRSLDGYTAVVVGAPLYMFRWHKDAKSFLSRHRQALMARPVAVFAMGPLKDEAKDWQDVRAQLDKELAGVPLAGAGRCRGLRRQARPGEADLPTQPDPGPQTDAGERHPRLDGDSRLGDRPDCEAPGRTLTSRKLLKSGHLEAPMGLAAKFVIPGVLFILTLVFGFWLSRSGKPYNGLIFNIHKLIALAAVIVAAIRAFNALKIVEAQPILIVLLILLGLCAVALFVTGALDEREQTGPRTGC